MSEYRNRRLYASSNDLPIMDMTNVADEELERVNRVNAGHKCKALTKMSAIVNHNLVASAGIMCQAKLMEQVAILSQHNPAAAGDLRELATANLLYVRDQIYNPNGRERY